MIKQKLQEKRMQMNLSQKQMADFLEIDQPQYNRRENGVTKISKKEWHKMAKILNTTLEKIYEPEDGIYVINNQSYKEEYIGDHSLYQYIPNHVLETMRKYITKLEEDNTSLINQIKILKMNL